MRNLPRWNPGDSPTLGRLNGQRRAAIANARARAGLDGSRVGMASTPSGHAIRAEWRRPIVGLLSGSSSPYTFAQAMDTASGYQPGPRVSGTAYEVNGAAGLGGSHQRLYPDRSGTWRFQDVRHQPAVPLILCNGCGIPAADLTFTWYWWENHGSSGPPTSEGPITTTLSYHSTPAGWSSGWFLSPRPTAVCLQVDGSGYGPYGGPCCFVKFDLSCSIGALGITMTRAQDASGTNEANCDTNYHGIGVSSVTCSPLMIHVAGGTGNGTIDHGIITY